MSDVKWAFGTALQIGDGLGGFTTIAEIMDFPFPQLSRDLKEVTNHSSPNGYEEFITTLKRSGEIQFNMNYLPTDPTHDSATGLISLWNSGAVTPFKIVMVDDVASEWTFDGIVTKFQARAPVNGQYDASTTIKPVGTVVAP